MINDFNLLRQKKILDILDGDKIFGRYDNGTVAMPYLRGIDICTLSESFGFPQEYTNLSRWQYLDKLLEYCINNDKIQDLLNYLFSKEGFKERFEKVAINKLDDCYSKVIQRIISEINHLLYFNDKELVFSNKTFIIKDINATIQPAIPSIKLIDRDYIKNLCKRANKDIEEGAFDSAVTKCRTLLEEVFCYAVEQTGEQPSDSGDIQKLYNQVKDAYNMHSNKDLDKRINNLLSGLNKIISSIAEMRNENSDSHGVGSRRIAIEEHHARLILNSASTLADFFLAVVERKQTQALQNITV